MVLGFAFDNLLTEVVLIEKQKPDFMKGKLNGIGGKLKVNEPIREGMCREFKEETGIETQPEDWTIVGTMAFEGGIEVYILRTYQRRKWNPKQQDGETEVPEVVDLDTLRDRKLMPNLILLIELCKNHADQWSYLHLR